MVHLNYAVTDKPTDNPWADISRTGWFENYSVFQLQIFNSLILTNFLMLIFHETLLQIERFVNWLAMIWFDTPIFTKMRMLNVDVDKNQILHKTNLQSS